MKNLKPNFLCLLLALLGVGCSTSAGDVNTMDGTCQATPLEDLLPSVISAMAGQHPIWLVDGSFGIWHGSEIPVQLIWVLSRDVPGDLVVRGRQLDGPEVLRWQEGVNAPSTNKLSIPRALDRSVIPGGATEAIMQRYAFVPTFIIYPSTGCWEITAQLGQDEARIVVEIRAKEKGD